MRDLVIVGAGPAGVATAIQASRLGLDLALVEATGRAGGLIEQAWRVENLPGVEPVPGTVIAARMRAHLERLGITPIHAHVTAIQREAGGLRIQTQGEPLSARAVVLATGTRARTLDLPGPLPVHTSVRALLDQRPHAVAVIGGGEAAVDQGLTLAEAGCRVHLLVRGAALRVRGRLAGLAHERLSLHLHTQALHSSLDGRLHLAIPSGPSTLAVDGVLVAIGRTAQRPALPSDTAGITIIGDARLGGLGQLGIAIGDGLAAAMRVAEETP